MTTTKSLRNQEIIETLLEYCPCVTRVDKKEANDLEVCDDFKHVSTGVYIEQKKAKVTANQIHPLKAGVLIISIADTQHIVVTMGEAFPYLSRQHTSTAWECGSLSSKRLAKDVPLVDNEWLNEAIDSKVNQYLTDTVFQEKQAKVRDLCNQHKEALNAI